MTARDPVVLVPVTMLPVPLTGEAAVAADAAAWSMRYARHQILARSDSPVVERALVAAARYLDQLVSSTAPWAATVLGWAADGHPAVIEKEMPKSPVEEILRYDGHFGMVRAPQATTVDVVATLAPVARDLVASLRQADVAADDKAHLLELVAWMLHPDVAREPEQGVAIGGVDPARPAAAARWRMGHQVFAYANRKAAADIARAIALDADGDLRGAAAALQDAEQAVRALNAAMIYAADMSAAVYERSVRPTMKLPYARSATGVLNLSGTHNSDHAVYRDSVVAVLEAWSEPYRELAEVSMELALARDALLHTDLYDLERHIVLSYRLVGYLPALDEDDDASAVQRLRQMYQRRLERYSPLMEHGWMTEQRSAS